MDGLAGPDDRIPITGAYIRLLIFSRCVTVSTEMRLGYETYGTLNDAKDNAILITHYFSGNSHAAGKYKEADVSAG
ncbi:hypothetical protein ACC694_38535, partial [Rhizobium ruizarguesonis]